MLPSEWLFLVTCITRNAFKGETRKETLEMNVTPMEQRGNGFSSFSETCQVLQTPDIVKEKENRGIFSFFQRSKKKREQVSILMQHVKILTNYF